jgi:hypothetical protein
MNYINIKTNQYPLSEQDIKALEPLKLFPFPFQPDENYAAVFPTPQISYDIVLETAQEDVPVLTSKGHWEQSWKIVQLYTKAADKTAAKAAYLALYKPLIKEQVNNMRKTKEAAGLAYVFPDSSGTIQTEDQDIRNVLAVTTAALVLKSQGVVDPVIQFRDKENVTHSLTPDEAIYMGMAVQSFISDTYSYAWDKKAEIDAATTLINLNKVVL